MKTFLKTLWLLPLMVGSILMLIYLAIFKPKELNPEYPGHCDSCGAIYGNITDKCLQCGN